MVWNPKVLKRILWIFTAIALWTRVRKHSWNCGKSPLTLLQAAKLKFKERGTNFSNFNLASFPKNWVNHD